MSGTTKHKLFLFSLILLDEDGTILSFLLCLFPPFCLPTIVSYIFLCVAIFVSQLVIVVKFLVICLYMDPKG